MNIQEFLGSKVIHGNSRNETVFVSDDTKGKFIIKTIDIINHKGTYSKNDADIIAFCKDNNISEFLYMKTIRNYVVHKGIANGGIRSLLQVPIAVKDVNSVIGVPEDECGGREEFGFKLSDLRGY